MSGITRDEGGIMIEIGGMSDHVHMLIKIKAAVSLANLIRHIKAGSSKWVSGNFSNTRYFAWQTGYGAFTVSESLVDRVCYYIQNQKRHHAKQSFDDEYKFFLKRNGISYDPKYALD